MLLDYAHSHRMRRTIIAESRYAGVGQIGSTLSIADIVAALQARSVTVVTARRFTG
jgi:transketolase N-terminal domain/subunit